MASIPTWLRILGIDPKRTISAGRNLRRYFSARKEFRKLAGGEYPCGKNFPVIDEWNDSSGSLGAYFFQDRMIARWIYEACPEKHYDVGSRLDGFVGSLSVFREVDVIDIRPQPVSVPNVTFHQMDLMEELPNEWVGKAVSLSCLHTIEHFGLGRYGDPIDPDGHLKGLAQLKRMVAPGGLFYLSTPIGPQRIEFNAHRVFALSTMLGWFGNGWEIERCAIINDSNRILKNIDPNDPAVQENFGCQLGVGIVAARKIRDF